MKKNSRPAKKSKPRDDFGARFRNAPVTYEDLKKALLAVDGMDPEDRKDFTARSMAVMRAFGLLTGKENKDSRRLIEKVTCVEIRLTAMARLVDSGILNKWTMDSGEEGSEFISEAVVRAAAEVPLLAGRKRSDHDHFDPEAFMAKVLEVADQGGSA